MLLKKKVSITRMTLIVSYFITLPLVKVSRLTKKKYFIIIINIIHCNFKKSKELYSGV